MISLVAMLHKTLINYVSLKSKMDFPEDFNQLELLNSHGHLIPRGANSMWTESTEQEDGEMEEETEEGAHSEEWYFQKEGALIENPSELVLWAAEHNRVSGHTCLYIDAVLFFIEHV